MGRAVQQLALGGPLTPLFLPQCNIVMYLIWTAPGGQHYAHGDGARGRKAGYQARYVMKVGGDEGSTGSIRLRMAGEEERCIPYEAAYIMDPTTGSLPNKHRVAPVKDNTCVLVVSVYRTDLTYDDIVGAIVAKSVERLQPFSLAAIEIKRPTALKPSTRASLGNTYGTANKGNTKPPRTKAHKDALSAAHKGKPLSKAHKDAISAAMKGKGKGKPRSQATKDAISAAKIKCICGICKNCKGRARVQEFRAKKAKKA